MNLFNEYYNSEVQCLLNLYSLNRPFTAMEATDCAREANVYTLTGTYAELLRRWEERELIARNGETYAPGPGFRPFVAPLNALESECLSDLRLTREAELFLPDALREKLNRLFPSVHGETSGLTERFASVGEGTPNQLPEAETFRTTLEAIAKGRRIGYFYNGDTQYAEVSPWRMEYNALDGRWWLISFWEKQDRTVKSRLDRLQKVSLLEQSAVSEETIRRAILKHLAPEPVVLRISGTEAGKMRNVAERCFIGFENMLEMTAVRRSDTEYELSFRYFHWDEKLIIRKLLALGEYVTLFAPKNMVNLMTENLRAALGRYKAD